MDDFNNILDSEKLASLGANQLVSAMNVPLVAINNQLQFLNSYYKQLEQMVEEKEQQLLDSLFIPRFHAEEPKLSGGQHVYDSPFWRQSPFGGIYYLPNCTCYAWGRYAEVAAHGDLGQLSEGLAHARRLPTGNGGTWVKNAPSSIKRTVQDLKNDSDKRKYLGAVIEWTGHVAIVEKIEEVKGKYVITFSDSWYRHHSKGRSFAFRGTSQTWLSSDCSWNGRPCLGFILQ